MSLIYDLDRVIHDVTSLKHKVKTRQRIANELIEFLVKLSQEHRINKNYEVSDRIRGVLNGVGVEIVYGTKQYGGYDKIPDNMKNRQIDDIWKWREPRQAD